MPIPSLSSSLIACLIWFNVWMHPNVVRVGNRPDVIVSTIASWVGILTSLIGWASILLNNRAFLASYTSLLWVVFALVLAPGYIDYKRYTFNLGGKVNQEWSAFLGVDGRLRIQYALQCCGYFDPLVEATVNQTYYARTVLPGRKLLYMETDGAHMVVHICVLVGPGTCDCDARRTPSSNHIMYRLGKGATPEVYRLNTNSRSNYG